MIKEAILKLLKSSAPLVALVVDRIDPDHLGQEQTLPAVSFRRATEAEGLVPHSGAVDVAEGVFQIDCFGNTPAEAEDLSDVVKGIFHGYSGEVVITPEDPPDPAVSVLIYRSVVVNRVDLSDPDLGVYHIPVDVRIKYKEV